MKCSILLLVYRYIRHHRLPARSSPTRDVQTEEARAQVSCCPANTGSQSAPLLIKASNGLGFNQPYSNPALKKKRPSHNPGPSTPLGLLVRTRTHRRRVPAVPGPAAPGALAQARALTCAPLLYPRLGPLLPAGDAQPRCCEPEEEEPQRLDDAAPGSECAPPPATPPPLHSLAPGLPTTP
jgi:hypothetical protein